MDDDERWLKRLGDKLGNFEEPAPDGLWDDIANSLAGARPRRIVPLWLRRASAAAAVAAIAVVAWLAIPHATVQPPLQSTETTTNDVNTLINKPNFTNAADARREAGYGMKNTTIATRRPARLFAAAGGAVDSLQVKPLAVAEADSTISSPSQQHSTSLHNQLSASSAQPMDIALPKTRHGRLSLNLYAANLTGDNSSVREDGPSLRSQYISGMGITEHSSIRNVVEMSNNNREVTRKMNHHFPVRAGLSLRYDFSSRFGITAGVQYSYLASDFSWGSEESFYTGTQRLHYVGLPVSAIATLWHNDRLCLYASAGAAVEKCIDGNTVTHYTLNGEPVARESADATEKRLQWSASAAVGLQCRLVGSLSLYAEPGACYYFDNHSSTDNIYKERPFNFNLNLGLRLTLQ